VHSDIVAGTDRSLRAGVLQHARCTPGRIAQRLAGRDISYAELVLTARRWAGRLIGLAAGRRSIHALDAFPLNDGKTDRRALRDWLALRVGPDGQPRRGDGILEATDT
jgi:hypothetical protein